MADFEITPEAKRVQELTAVLCEKRSNREILVSNINKLKVEFENNLRRMEKDLEKHEAAIESVRIQLRVELSKLDKDIFPQTDGNQGGNKCLVQPVRSKASVAS
jgi:hypothetical protein